MLIPIIGALPQQYILYDNLGLINSPMFLYTYVGGTAYQLYSFTVFTAGCPTNTRKRQRWTSWHYTIMLKIMLPMSLPMSLAIGIITFIGYWNDYMTVLLFLPDFPTLATGLYLFQSQRKSAPLSALLCGDIQLDRADRRLIRVFPEHDHGKHRSGRYKRINIYFKSGG